MKRQPDSQVDASVDALRDESVNPLLVEIGGRIKHARQAVGMTQDELATLAGAKSKSGLQDNERGRSMPGGYIIGALARRGINTNWIFTGEGEVMLRSAQQAPNSEGLAVSGHIYQSGAQSRLQLAAEATPAVVDMVLLQKVTDFLFQWQADHNTRLDQDKIGAIIAILYRIAASSGKVRKAELEQVLAIAA